jgi:predicted amidohydrolase
MQVAAIQFAPEKGKLAPNLDRIADGILQAAAENCDLVAFPETATTGYFLEGGVVELCITAQQLADELTQRLKGKLTNEIDVVTGYYQLEDGNIYNSSAFLRCNATGAEHKSSYQKFFLPTYGVFDEDRFVSRGRSLGVVNTKLGKTGMMICEDGMRNGQGEEEPFQPRHVTENIVRAQRLGMTTDVDNDDSDFVGSESEVR